LYLVAGTSPPYSIRTAAARDLLAVARLIDQAPDKAEDALSDLQRTTWHRMMATADLTIYVAANAGEVVGTTSLLVMPHITYDCRPSAFIEPVLVAEPHRRRGVATMLLQRAHYDAGAANCRKV
jgi:GNAT superfamily N-acetyltransferase